VSAPGRYAPRRAFPAYAYLPGRDPHPVRDPRGHSFGAAEAPATYLEAARWRDNETYLFGVDLYNHGFLWEAHEAWEGLWHAARNDAPQADFLQGLIQCAAAALKIPMEQPRGLERLAALGTERMERAAGGRGSYMGLHVEAFVAAFRAFAGSPAPRADARPLIRLG
jgi:uncharacterized protein